MGWKDYLWKDPPNSIYEGTHSKLLKVSRSVSLVIMLYVFLSHLISYPVLFFTYMTSWGATSTMVFFALAVLTMKVPALDKVVFVMHSLVWSLEWVITVYFWGAIAPVVGVSADQIIEQLEVHGVPLLLILFDFVWNRVQIFRQYYLIVWSFILIYTVSVNLPVALEVHAVYPGMTYTNVFTYLAMLGIFLLSLVSLELGRLVKNKQLQNLQTKSGALSLSLAQSQL